MVEKRITLSQAIDGYFVAANARRLSPHTLADYDNTFRRFGTFLGNDLSLPCPTSPNLLGARGFRRETLPNQRGRE